MDKIYVCPFAPTFNAIQDTTYEEQAETKSRSTNLLVLWKVF